MLILLIIHVLSAAHFYSISKTIIIIVNIFIVLDVERQKHLRFLNIRNLSKENGKEQRH